jgi:hypothetical protein
MQVGLRSRVTSVSDRSLLSDQHRVLKSPRIPGHPAGGRTAARGEGNWPARIQIVEVEDATSLAGLEVGRRRSARLYTNVRSGPSTSLTRASTGGASAAKRRQAELLEAICLGGRGRGHGPKLVLRHVGPPDARAHRISDSPFRLLPAQRELAGVVYTDEDHREAGEAGSRTALLDARGVELVKHLAFVSTSLWRAAGRAHRLQMPHPQGVVGGAFSLGGGRVMLRQIHTHPRVIANFTRSTTPDTVHPACAWPTA